MADRIDKKIKKKKASTYKTYLKKNKKAIMKEFASDLNSEGFDIEDARDTMSENHRAALREEKSERGIKPKTEYKSQLIGRSTFIRNNSQYLKFENYCSILGKSARDFLGKYVVISDKGSGIFTRNKSYDISAMRIPDIKIPFFDAWDDFEAYWNAFEAKYRKDHPTVKEYDRLFPVSSATEYGVTMDVLLVSFDGNMLKSFVQRWKKNKKKPVLVNVLTKGHIFPIILWPVKDETDNIVWQADVWNTHHYMPTRQEILKNMLTALQEYLDKELPNFTIINNTPKKDLQGPFKLPDGKTVNDKWCQTWVWYYAYLRVRAGCSPQVINARLEAMTPNERYNMLIRFYHIINDPELPEKRLVEGISGCIQVQPEQVDEYPTTGKSAADMEKKIQELYDKVFGDD